MARAKVFCAPSVVAASGDAEGFGIVFIEAQAMGLPVVSTRSGGIPEAVEDGQTGLLVTQNDPDGLAQAILRLLQDGELWQRFSTAGRRRVIRQFNLAQQTRRLEDLFSEVVVSRKQPWGADMMGLGRAGTPARNLTAYLPGKMRNASQSEPPNHSTLDHDRRSVDSGSIN